MRRGGGREGKKVEGEEEDLFFRLEGEDGADEYDDDKEEESTEEKPGDELWKGRGARGGACCQADTEDRLENPQGGNEGDAT